MLMLAASLASQQQPRSANFTRLFQPLVHRRVVKTQLIPYENHTDKINIQPQREKILKLARASDARVSVRNHGSVSVFL